MVIGQVHWGAYDGPFLEKLMAVFVAQDHPDVIRRTPARGDGGIDLLIPKGKSYAVDQVKGFASRLGASEKRQIKDSWDEVVANPRTSRPIVRYRLVVPVDLTPSEQEWFEELTTGALFPATVCGRPYWDSMAAQHPNVVDYMIGGGRDRVAQRAKALFSTALDPTRPITPSDVAASLETMRLALNREDPNYRYHFLTSELMPGADQVEDCAMAESRQLDDGSFLTIRVVPTHRYALDDEPIRGTVRVAISDAEQAAKFRDQYEGFVNFGRALDIPDGTLFGEMAAPGGLGGEIKAGGGRIGAAEVAVPPTCWRVVIRDPDGGEVAECRLTTSSVTQGLKGGLEIHAASDAGLLQMTLSIHPEQSDGCRRLDWNLGLENIAGARVVDAVGPLGVATHLEAGNELQLLPEFGTTPVIANALTVDETLASKDVFWHVEDLVTLQKHASFAIKVPEEFQGSFANQLRQIARMLRGETITGSWDEVTLNLKPGVTRAKVTRDFAMPAPVVLDEERYVDLPDGRVNLGRFTSQMAEALVAPDQPKNKRQLRLVPGRDHTMTRRAGAAFPDRT